MVKTFSGKEIIKVLCRDFGFSFVSQKGSHVKLRRRRAGTIETAIVSLHRELARGTLLGILELAGVDKAEFLVAVKK